MSVAGAGDVNGDGYDDVIVGAQLYDSGEDGEGAAFIFLGGVAGIDNGIPDLRLPNSNRTKLGLYLVMLCLVLETLTVMAMTTSSSARLHLRFGPKQ
ncbi:MAG: FG-GAP repeat protein [Deltaproteobacteria bacterium]|nr:FG-GAP repeat protein [Deltaproteobacteria bacterium]